MRGREQGHNAVRGREQGHNAVRGREQGDNAVRGREQGHRAMRGGDRDTMQCLAVHASTVGWNTCSMQLRTSVV